MPFPGVSSIVMRRERTLARNGLSPRPPSGSRDRRGDRNPTLPAHAPRRSARRRRPRSRLRRHRLRLPGADRVPAGDRGRASPSSASSTAAARPTRAARARSSRCCWSCSLVLGALWPAASIADVQRRLVAGRTDRRRRGLARLHGRPLAVRPRQRPPGRRGREGAPALRRGHRRCSPPGSRSSSRRWPILVVARARLAADRRAPPGRREVRRASRGRSSAVKRSSSSPSSTR